MFTTQSFDITLALQFLTLATIMIWCLGILLNEIHDCIAGYTTWSHSFGLFDSNRKVGGIRFLKLGRLNVSISISKRKEA